MSKKHEFKGPSQSLRSLQDQENVLLGELRGLLNRPSTAGTRLQLLRIIGRLLVNLPRQHSLACQNGYLSVVLERRPSWCRQVDSLQGANLWCVSALQELHDQIERESPSATIEVKDGGAIDIWIRSLAAVRSHECRLLQGAFTLDIGGEA